MIKTHKIKLNLTSEQATYFYKAAGTRRFVYNWGLVQWTKQYQEGKKPSARKMRDQFNAIKRIEFPWIYDVAKNVVEGAFMDLGAAFNNFFEGRAKYPKFKAKKKTQEGFYLANDKFYVRGYYAHIPKLGRVNMTEKLRFLGKILCGRITQDKVGDWSISITVEMPEQPQGNGGLKAGLDLGVMRLATLSNGNVFENQRYYAKAEHCIKRRHRDLSRKQPNSKNREKARIKLAKAYRRVTRLREDYLQKRTLELAETYGFLGIENLSVKNMMKNHHLSKALGDVALGRFEELLISKSATTGCLVQPVGRFFPSSKLCSQCGIKHHNLKLSDRMFVCPNPICLLKIDRDLNAAINILHEAWRLASEEDERLSLDTNVPVQI